jgi:hypothetical protein
MHTGLKGVQPTRGKTMTKILLKDNPEISRIVRSTFPNYRKKSAFVSYAGQVTLTDLEWSGGTRHEYQAYAWISRVFDICAMFNRGHRHESMLVPVLPGMAIVQCGHFCGKDATAHVTLNRADKPDIQP